MKNGTAISATLAGLALAASASAQYAITSFTIDGGGGTLTGPTYTLTGTIGQADAGVLTGAGSTLYGGFWRPMGPVTPCPGDIANNDGMIDIDDLNVILSSFGATVGIGSPADVANNDGVIDIDDLNVILSNFGLSCR